MVTTQEVRFTLPDEVLKTRRNLIVLSFVTMAILYISPTITKITVIGVEVELRHNSGIIYLLMAGLILESINYTIRYFTGNLLFELAELEDRLKEMKLGPTGHMDHIDNALGLVKTIIPQKDNQLDVTSRIAVEAYKQRYSFALSRVSTYTTFSEFVLPFTISSFAFLWALYEVLPIFPRHLFP